MTHSFSADFFKFLSFLNPISILMFEVDPKNGTIGDLGQISVRVGHSQSQQITCRALLVQLSEIVLFVDAFNLLFQIY
jgi:hypothetical protein